MAIIVNGSSAAGLINLGSNGTISNLAVGGLPDGTVDGDTLASGVGGKVLQVVGAEEANYVANPSGYTTFFDLDITPVSASSKFIVNISSFYMLNDGREIQLRCRDSSSTYVGGIREFKNAAGGDIKAPFQATWYMDQSYSTGSATTFLVEFDDNGSTTAVGSSTSTWKSTMVIYEVLV